MLVLAGLVGLVARRWLAAVLHIAAGLALAGVLTAIRPEGGPAPVSGAADGDELSGLYANVGPWNREYARLIDLVASVDPDIIGLAEIDRSWTEALAPLASRYPYRLEVPRPDAFGLGLFSRYPMSDTSTASVAEMGIPTIRATIETPTGPWRVAVAHPAVPAHGAAFAARNRLLAFLPEWARRDTTPAIVLADLNATVWSPFVRDMALRGLRPASSGLRPLYTWPTFFPPLGLGLDHCLVWNAIPRSFSVLPSIGSDHFPIACRVAGAARAGEGPRSD